MCVASGRPSAACFRNSRSFSSRVTYRSLLVTPRSIHLPLSGRVTMAPVTMSSRSTVGRGSPTIDLTDTTDHSPALPPTKVNSRGLTATSPLTGSAPVALFQPPRAATPPAVIASVRNALRLRPVSDRGSLPAESSRFSTTVHLRFLPPNQRITRGCCLSPATLRRPGERLPSLLLVLRVAA